MASTIFDIVGLKDGQVLTGTVDNLTIKIKTSVADIEVSQDKISSLHFSKDKKTDRIAVEGSVLVGIIDLEEIDFTISFNQQKLKINRNDIAGIAFNGNTLISSPSL
jgi:hypothetical protein